MPDSAPRLRIDAVDVFVRRVPTRMPFRFGKVTMTELEVAYLRAGLQLADGTRVEGVSSSVLSPMWFDKSAALSYGQKDHRLRRAITLAVEAGLAAGQDTAYGLHQHIQPAVREACAAEGILALASSFGVALLDGAVVDGLCRAAGRTFHQGLQQDLFGFGPVPGLPARPSPALALRHTVGLADPLSAAEVQEALDDGLPETLEEVVRRYGVHYFKVKIADDPAANLARIGAIQEVLDHAARGDYRLVFDGNEAFADMDGFCAFFEAFRSDARLEPIYTRTLWFEQPVERSQALEARVRPALQELSRHKPVILDESDGSDETVEAALKLGYGGVSAKNCKGLFRTLHSFRVLQQQETPGILAAEDLTHPGLRALQQDSAVVAALGIEHAERNGHHYVRGLNWLSEQEQDFAATHLARLYARGSDGLLHLRIEDGRFDCSQLNTLAYGGPLELDLEELERLDLPASGEESP